MSKANRELLADWLMLLASPVVLGSLFLTWSHQLSRSLRAAYGATALLRGVPRDPTAWQVYSVADVLLALVAAGLLSAALRGQRTARVVLALAVAVALAFTVHAMSVAPTNGATAFDPAAVPPRYVANAATSGTGETVALVGLAVGMAGVLLSMTAD
jgi:hypothetical protein